MMLPGGGGMMSPWAALGSMSQEMIQQMMNFPGMAGVGMSLDPSKTDHPFAPPFPGPGGMGAFSQLSPGIPGLPGSGNVPGSRFIPPGGIPGEYPKELLKRDEKKVEEPKKSGSSGLAKALDDVLATTTQKSSEEHKKGHLEKFANEKLRDIAKNRENKEKSASAKTLTSKTSEKSTTKSITPESAKDDTPIVDLLKQTVTPAPPGGGHWKKRLKEANKDQILKPSSQTSKISPDKPSTLLNLISSTPTPEITKPTNQKSALPEKSPLAKKLPSEAQTTSTLPKPPVKLAETPTSQIQKENLATAQIWA